MSSIAKAKTQKMIAGIPTNGWIGDEQEIAAAAANSRWPNQINIKIDDYRSDLFIYIISGSVQMRRILPFFFSLFRSFLSIL